MDLAHLVRAAAARIAVIARLVRFLAVGAALFAVRAWLVPAGELGARALERETLTISREQLGALRKEWVARTGTLPDAREARALVDGAATDEMLFREALARGLHGDDALVRERLVRNMRFIAPDGSESDAALLREARALGMERSDTVVRRHLVERMKRLARDAARASEPGHDELSDFFARRSERFVQPARVRLSHLYLDPRRRGDDLAARARRLRDELEESGIGPAGAQRRGDAFLHPPDLPLLSRSQLEKRFGPRFAQVALALEPGVWSGPVPSSYGLHLVWVHAFVGERSPPLDAVRGAVREALFAERAEELLASALRALRERYEVRLEDARPSVHAGGRL